MTTWARRSLRKKFSNHIAVQILSSDVVLILSLSSFQHGLIAVTFDKTLKVSLVERVHVQHGH